MDGDSNLEKKGCCQMLKVIRSSQDIMIDGWEKHGECISL
jgi:hypothetical protein